jgi:hypothetical protein
LKKAQSLRNQSVAFLFLCCWWLFGGRGHLCFVFGRSFCFLMLLFVAQRLMVFPISISAMS